MNYSEFSSVHDIQKLHLLAKEKIDDFVRTHFYGHLNFDLNKTLYFFIATYEYRNKGVDIFIRSLDILNTNSKSSGSDTTTMHSSCFRRRHMVSICKL